MKLAKIIAWIGLLARITVLVCGFSLGKFVEDGKAILANPWGIVSLVDLYVGFSLFSIWIVYREVSIPFCSLGEPDDGAGFLYGCAVHPGRFIH